MFSTLTTLIVVATCAIGTSAGAVAAVRDTQLVTYPHIIERAAPVKLGSINVATSLQNQTLFSGVVGVGNDEVSGQVQFDIKCVDCRTWGTAIITTTGVTKNNSVIGDLEAFFKHPEDTIINALDVNIEIALGGIGGHYEFDLTTTGTVAYTFPIFMSETPLGVALSPDLTTGLVFILDLTFALGAQVDMTSGFEVLLPPGSSIVVNPLNGHIVSSTFAGATADGLPVTVTNGKATFVAALKARVQFGSTVKLFGTGFDFEAGLFLNVIQYTAEFSSTNTCPLLINQVVDIDAGAFAKAAVAIDYVNFGILAPPLVTTIFAATLPSLCASIGAAKSTTRAATTTVTSGLSAKTSTPPMPTPKTTTFPSTTRTTVVTAIAQKSPVTLTSLATPIVSSNRVTASASSISYAKPAETTSYTPLNPGFTANSTRTSTAAQRLETVRTTTLTASSSITTPASVLYTSVNTTATSTGSSPAKFTGGAASNIENRRRGAFGALVAVACMMIAL